MSTRQLSIRTFAARSALLLICSVAIGNRACADTPLKAITDAVDRHYNSVTTMSADFTETYTSAGTTRNESGTLLLKKPGKMLWNYTAPRAKVFLSDGKTAYFYVPGEPQGRKMPMKNLDDFRSPLRYLLGHTKLQKEFQSLKIISDSAGTTVLQGIPKGMSQQISTVQLTIRDNNIIAIRIEQIDGSVTAFAFSNEHDNLTIPDSKFRADVPPGTHWIESSQLDAQ